MEVKGKTYWEIAKVIIFITVITFGVILALKGYAWINLKQETNKTELKAELEANRQILELKINQARAETQIVEDNSSEWKNEIEILKKSNSEMIELIKKNDEEIKNIGTITSSVNENVSLVLKASSDHSYLENTGDPNEQYFKKVTASEKDKDGNEITIPIGWSIFYPNTKIWKTGIYPLEYKNKIVQTEQGDGQWNTYVEAWAENNKDDESVGKKLPMKVTSEFIQLKKETTEFYWWSPHLSLSLDATNNQYVGAGISFSIAGYGRTKNDLTWKFGEFGIGGNDENSWMRFSPVGYNIGEKIPFINNTFLSPFIGYGDMKYMGGVSLNVPF